MKMTMHIDEDLLTSVMETYDLETKTDAVHYALRELDRRGRLRKVLETGMEMSEAELRDSVYETYNLESLRAAEGPES